MDVPDYYEVLGVPSDADPDQIKQVYRKLAMKYHPDSYRGDDNEAAEERFKRLSEAYEVLSDTEKRSRYDQLRSGRRAATAAPSGGRHMSPEEFEQVFGGRGFSDFFAEYFGQDMAATVGRGPRQHRRFRYRGSDVRASIGVPLALAVRGGSSSFEVEATTVCNTCGGSGLIEAEHICPACGGLGRRRGRRRVDVRIPEKLRNGQTLRLKGLGEPGVEGGEAGDLYLTVAIVGDDVYEPDGDDVHAVLPVAPWEAALGAKVPVQTLERQVTLTIPPNTAAGAKLRLAGEGLPRSDGSRGDFFVNVTIAMPQRLDEQQRELLRKLRDTGGATVRGGARVNGSVS